MIALVAVLATLLLVAIATLAAGGIVVIRRELATKADQQVTEALQDRLLAGLYIEKVVVTLSSGETFTGLLADVDEKSLMLREAVALAGEQRMDVDGELLIPRADVLYLQKP